MAAVGSRHAHGRRAGHARRAGHVRAARPAVAVPAAIFRYRNETFRILADICWGTGALLVGGGTIGVMVLLSLSAGTSLGIEGFNGLELIGLSPLTGFVSAVVNTRELAPLIAALALASQVGCRFTAQIGSMRAHEEIDALEVARDRADRLPGRHPPRRRDGRRSFRCT